MAKYKVKVTHTNGSVETKTLYLPGNSEQVEAEAETYFDDIRDIDISRL